jgi:RimJ/RimL family protein N-acetyltransferase
MDEGGRMSVEKIEPLLIDLPSEFRTERLTLRTPRAGDGPMVCASVRESLPELKPWMPWAVDDYAERDGELWCRRNAGEFLARKLLNFLILLPDGQHAGNMGAFAFEWDVPRCEVGYWLRTSLTGRGYMTEAVNGLAAMLLAKVQVRRMEIRTDDKNARSARVAERCGFVLEGTFRQDFRYPDGRLRDTRVYAKLAAG